MDDVYCTWDWCIGSTLAWEEALERGMYSETEVVTQGTDRFVAVVTQFSAICSSFFGVQLFSACSVCGVWCSHICSRRSLARGFAVGTIREGQDLIDKYHPQLPNSRHVPKLRRFGTTGAAAAGAAVAGAAAAGAVEAKERDTEEVVLPQFTLKM
jgi:hypothetical protein